MTQGTLNANPTSLGFGSVQVGYSANLSETLTNTGGSTVTISQANLTGAAFSVGGLTLPLNLTANQSVTFTATFAPTSAGAASGSLWCRTHPTRRSLSRSPGPEPPRASWPCLPPASALATWLSGRYSTRSGE